MNSRKAVTPFCSVHFGNWFICMVVLVLLIAPLSAAAGDRTYPHNAMSCEQCHALPSKFGSSPMTVLKVGSLVEGKFVPGPEGGVHHRQGRYAESAHPTRYEITGKRISISLLGDGYIEAIDPRDIEQNVVQQQRAKLGIGGIVVHAPALESVTAGPNLPVGRFGWKSQHSSLMSACADSTRNELGMRNRLYPEEYSTHSAQDGPTPIESDYPQSSQTSLDRVVEEVRHTAPPAPDPRLSASHAAQAGEKIFARIGCALCHVPTYKTMPTGTLINGGTYKIPDLIGNKVIHPYSDFLLHDVGTGDGIPQAAKPDLLDQSTSNQFRTSPLWGLSVRSWLMHDGESTTYAEAIRRHRGEASTVRHRYQRLLPAEKKQLKDFLDSL
jgi:CxxC motif-containing protein (DUF1111 family)